MTVDIDSCQPKKGVLINIFYPYFRTLQVEVLKREDSLKVNKTIYLKKYYLKKKKNVPVDNKPL